LYRSAPLFFFLGITVWMCGGVAEAARIKIPLIREAVVRGGSIYLSDLLPDTSPSEIRIMARGILVGQSPHPGSIRVLSNGAMVRLLGEENMLNDVDVPEQILVRRSGRPITREEVMEAIDTTLRRNEMFATVEIAPAALRFPADVLVSTARAELRVTRVEMDRTLHLMKFWLVSGADSAILPFMVMARPTGGTNDLAKMLGLPPIHDTATGAQSQSNAAAQSRVRVENGVSDLHPEHQPERAVTSVEAGKIARLHLVSGTGTQIFLTVTALERGAIGQRIRVKIQTTGKILDAQVVGRGQLEAEY
jgi:hypothetical protein